MSFAKVTIVGRLGRDPEVRYTPNGAMNVQFSIAADGRKREENAPATWFRVTAWDRLAERLVSLQEKGYVGKGASLYVEGQLESREYQANDGQTRTSLDVTLTDFQFVGGGQRQDAGAARQAVRGAGDEAVVPGSDDLSSVPF